MNIHGREYFVHYNPKDMNKKWYSAFLEVEPRRGRTILEVYPGDIRWRTNFIERMRNRKMAMLLSKRPNEVPLPNELLKNIGRRYLGGRTTRRLRKHRPTTRKRR